MDNSLPTTTLTRLCDFNFLIMHVVPTRASSPQHKSINTLTGHQALNLKSKSLQGIKPQRKEQKLTGHKALNRMTMHGLNNLQLEQHQHII